MDCNSQRAVATFGENDNDRCPSGELVVRRYFFTVRWSDHEDDDQVGLPFRAASSISRRSQSAALRLKDDAAALDYARRMAQGLKAGGGYDDPGLAIEVRNELHQIVLYVPFLAACA